MRHLTIRYEFDAPSSDSLYIVVLREETERRLSAHPTRAAALAAAEQLAGRYGVEINLRDAAQTGDPT